MDAGNEVIAVVLSESQERWHAGQLGRGAQRLVRHSDGTVGLEPVASEEEFERIARSSGCFRRGKPIRDPAYARSHRLRDGARAAAARGRVSQWP